MLKIFRITDFFRKIRNQKKLIKLRNKPARSLEKFKKLFPNYEIGRCSYGLPVINQQHKASVLKIGSYCSIASNVQIFMGGMHRTDWITTYPFPAFEESAQHIQNYATTRGNVIIGSDVWLCQNSTILSGVNIGHGAVVANNAVVTKDVPPYAIVGGNPAKLLRWRFDEATRETLLSTAWWDWPEEEILGVVELLCKDNIKEFINYAKNRKTTS